MDFKYYIIYKPYGMLPQFSDADGRPTLGQLYSFPKDVYPVGRLDLDSEGLLIITNDKRLNHRLLDPKFKHKREYLVQVDGDVTPEAIAELSNGVTISVNKKKHNTLPAIAKKMEDVPELPERNPPVRYRKSIPTSFVSLTLTEGKNRQVRKMTAAVGFPTLRLIRVKIEKLRLGQMNPGEVMELKRDVIYKALFGKSKI
ncbi:pseudouridine synthase [Limibacter armeniacum]|uniref:pseudouridine synthase n=1 Tax=Limibacter armeniacum TaxID=466084 RepID=UPI002FE58851